MLVYYFVEVARPFAEAEPAVLGLLGGLQAAAGVSYREVEVLQTRVGLPHLTIPQRRAVGSGTPMRADGKTTIPLNWDTTGPPALFPRMEADLVIAGRRASSRSGARTNRHSGRWAPRSTASCTASPREPSAGSPSAWQRPRGCAGPDGRFVRQAGAPIRESASAPTGTSQGAPAALHAETEARSASRRRGTFGDVRGNLRSR